ncbi:zinc-binding dehydrogenase [Nocardia niwae]|nr:zinc-binding dehydrogenase [Nocardia niwae]
MAEPAGIAWRAFEAAGVTAGERLLILGPGTIGLLCAMFARAAGAEVHLLGPADRSLQFARTLGFDGVWTSEDLPRRAWHGVVDASNASSCPGLATELVEPGRRVVLVGLAGTPSYIDSRQVALKDVTLVGILGASAGLRHAIASLADGSVDPLALVSAVSALEDVTDVLSSRPLAGAGPGPKTLIDLKPEIR